MQAGSGELGLRL